MDILKKITKYDYYILYFFIYATLGWLMEVTYAYSEFGHFINRGFLFGPLCPLYGYSGLILILFFSNHHDNSLKLFFTAGIVFTIFEYITSYFLETLFLLKWWDYSTHLFNINGRVTLAFSFVWGIIAILFINKIHPYVKKKTEKLINKFPVFTFKIILSFILLIYFIDTGISVYGYIINKVV